MLGVFVDGDWVGYVDVVVGDFGGYYVVGYDFGD